MPDPSSHVAGASAAASGHSKLPTATTNASPPPTGTKPAGGPERPVESDGAPVGCLIMVFLTFFGGLWYVGSGVYSWISQMYIANSLAVEHRSEACGLGFTVISAQPGKTELRFYTVSGGAYGDGFKEITLPPRPRNATAPSAVSARGVALDVSLEKLCGWGQTHAANVTIECRPGSRSLLLNVVRGIEARLTGRRTWQARYWRDEVEIGLKADGTVASASFRSVEKPAP